MQIAIVDDEPVYRSLLKTSLDQMVGNVTEDYQICVFPDGQAFLDSLNQGAEYQIVFMDIFMPKMSGIEAAAALRDKDKECFLVFLTTSSEHYPEAFSCHAFEYVTKPFTQERIGKVLEDIFKLLPMDNASIAVTASNVNMTLPLREILAVTSDGHYMDFHCKNMEDLRVRMTGKELVEALGNDGRFLMVNRGIFVNLDEVEDYDEGNIRMKSGEDYPVAVRNASRIIQEITNYRMGKL